MERGGRGAKLLMITRGMGEMDLKVLKYKATRPKIEDSVGTELQS
jgi:hypothetical protein